MFVNPLSTLGAAALWRSVCRVEDSDSPTSELAPANYVRRQVAAYCIEQTSLAPGIEIRPFGLLLAGFLGVVKAAMRRVGRPCCPQQACFNPRVTGSFASRGLEPHQATKIVVLLLHQFGIRLEHHSPVFWS